MLTRLNGLMKLGLQPITPITTFSGEDSGQAFRYLQQGTHIGKVVLSMPEDTSSIPSSLSPRRISFDGTATYLLAGGLGGLGRSLAIWLVESGARHLTFLSRSAGISEQSKQLFQELKAMGCSVHAVAGGVDKMDDVKKAISLSKAPIKGVFQLAMVLDVCIPLLPLRFPLLEKPLGHPLTYRTCPGCTHPRHVLVCMADCHPAKGPGHMESA